MWKETRLHMDKCCRNLNIISHHMYVYLLIKIEWIWLYSSVPPVIIYQSNPYIVYFPFLISLLNSNSSFPHSIHLFWHMTCWIIRLSIAPEYQQMTGLLISILFFIYSLYSIFTERFAGFRYNCKINSSAFNLLEMEYINWLLYVLDRSWPHCDNTEKNWLNAYKFNVWQCMIMAEDGHTHKGNYTNNELN